MQAIAHLFGLFIELMRPILAPFANWLAPTLTPFIERAGAINVLILLSLMMWLLIILAVAMILMRMRRMMLKAITVHREWKARCEAEAIKREAENVAENLRITDDCVDIGMAPSLMFPSDISGMLFEVCANGGVPDVVEGIFHDLECKQPCAKHPDCQFAH